MGGTPPLLLLSTSLFSDTEKMAQRVYYTRAWWPYVRKPEALNKELKKHSRACRFTEPCGEIEVRAVQERMRYRRMSVSQRPYEVSLVRDRIRKEDAIVTYDGGALDRKAAPTLNRVQRYLKKAPQATERRIAKR